MKRISRVDALIQASEALQNNDIVRANRILKIVDNSIAKDKRNNTYSEYIELERDEKKYFIEK